MITPLMYSMKYGVKAEGFRHLLERGADPNLPYEEELSTVGDAASRPSSDFLQIVLAHGGNPNIYCPPHRTV